MLRNFNASMSFVKSRDSPFASAEFNWLSCDLLHRTQHCSHPASGDATMENNYWTPWLYLEYERRPFNIDKLVKMLAVALPAMGNRAMNAHSLRWRTWWIIYNNKTSEDLFCLRKIYFYNCRESNENMENESTWNGLCKSVDTNLWRKRTIRERKKNVREFMIKWKKQNKKRYELYVICL